MPWCAADATLAVATESTVSRWFSGIASQLLSFNLNLIPDVGLFSLDEVK